MKNILNYIWKHKIITAIIIIVVVGGSYYWYKKAHAVTTVKYVTQPATKQTLIVSVSATGQVSAADQVDLKPQTTGTITAVKVKQGQEVKTGDVIAVIDQQNTSNQINQAQASLDQAQANYDQVVAGTTSNDVQLAKLSLDSAQKALDTAKQDYTNTVTQQQQDVSQAYSDLLNSGLQLQQSDTTTTATATLSGTYSGTDKGTYTISLSQTASGTAYSVSGLSSTYGYVNRGVPQSIGNGLYITFGTSGTISPSTTWSVAVPNTTSSSYTSNLNSYNQALDTQTQDIQKAQDSIDSAQNNLDQAQIQYNEKIQPPTTAAVASAAAQLASAKAQLANAETAYKNNIITAPFDGVIAQLDVSTGDQAITSTTLATIITKQQISNISLNEVDAAKVQAGMKATITFDAVDGLTMTGQVGEIDTIGTVSQGVVTYSAKIVFDYEDDRIKPGMSTDVTIITNSKTDALTVPSAAIKTSPVGGSYVQVLDSSGKPQNVTVQTGISNDTDTEITSGLNEGQNVVTQTITSSTTKTPAITTGTSSLRIPGLTGGAATGFGGGGGTRTFTGGGTGAGK